MQVQNVRGEELMGGGSTHSGKASQEQMQHQGRARADKVYFRLVGFEAPIETLSGDVQ